MPKNNRKPYGKFSAASHSPAGSNQPDSIQSADSNHKRSGWAGHVRRHRLALGLIILLSISFISALAYRNLGGTPTSPAARAGAQSTPPKLAKEYIYAGSRLVVIEDAGADSKTQSDGAVR